MRRKYKDRENFQFPGFIEVRLLECLEHDFTNTMSVCDSNFLSALEQKLIGGIA